MTTWLPFRFTDAALVEWLTEDDESVQGNLDELADNIGHRQPLLVIPGEMTVLNQVNVPGRNRATVLKAIPYALEDNLAEDVEDLHFAVGPITPGMSIPVAVIRHAALEKLLNTCAEAGITPAAAIPEPLLLPYEDETWSLLVEEEKVVLRYGLWDGFATEPDNLELLLTLALNEVGDQTPSCLRVWGEVTPELASLAIEIRSEALSIDPLAILASGFQHSSSINLLQGPYSRQAQLGKWLRPWRVAAALMGCWLGLQLILQINDYSRLKQEQANLRSEMVRIYKDAVPDAKRIVNPRAQLENHLQQLRGTDNGEEAFFLTLLHQGGQALLGVEGITLQGLRYKPNQLDLDLESSSLETFDLLEQRFNEQTQVNAQMRTTKQEDKAESRVTLRKTTS